MGVATLYCRRVVWLECDFSRLTDRQNWDYSPNFDYGELCVLGGSQISIIAMAPGGNAEGSKGSPKAEKVGDADNNFRMG